VVAVVSTEEVSVVVSAVVALVPAGFAAALWLPNPLQAESGAAVVALALAVPVSAAADFAQPRIGITALILPLEVSAAQPVHSDITTEAAARLLLGHTNSAEGKTNRPDRMPAGTQPLLASRIDRLY
jgi:hypothetical protein